MSWSRFITVENLCIAAEVTAAMLLLAFAIPEQRVKVKTSEKDDSNSLLFEVARRAFLEEMLARSLERLAMLESSRPAVDRSERLASEFSDAEAMGWIDRLSGTYNRSFIDVFLNRWLALPNENRLGSYLSMISLKDYTELVRDSGPVQVELMLRDLGNRLKTRCTDQAIVARLPPDRFLLLTFDADPSVGTQCVESASEAAGDPESTPEDKSKPMSLVCSVVELSEESSSFEDVVGQLETGIDAATQLGEKFFFKQGSGWTSDIPSPSNTKRKTSSHSNDSSLPKKERKSTTTAEVAEETASVGASPNASGPDDTTVESLTEGSSTVVHELDALDANSVAGPVHGKTADVSAVASNEEIAALFAQIKKHENKSEKSQDTTAIEAGGPPNATASDSAPQSLRAENGTEPLLAVNPQSAAGPQSITGPQSAIDILSATEQRLGNEPQSATESLSDSDSVSANDIASLFAAFKPDEVLKTLPTDVSSQSTQTSGELAKANERSVDIAELESMSETATADDIAELFKAVQQERKEDKPVPAPPKPVANRRFAQEIEDLSETATTDDIAELFKAVKSGLGPTKDTEPSSPTPMNEDLEETANADDIAALFASVKREAVGKGSSGKRAEDSKG
jgi:epidermal growth factor receptor substrate 15